MSDASPTEAPLDLLVVGAGLTGLSTAWRARRAGLRVALVEASSRVGGVIRTETVAGYRIERAAASFPSQATHLLEVNAGLQEPVPVRTPDPGSDGQFLWTRRGLVSMPRTPPALLASPLLPASAKLRAAAEVLRGRDRVRGAESAHTFVRRRFGSLVAERFLRPMTLGIYGSRPENLGARDAFPTLVAMEDEGSLLRSLLRRRKAAARSIVTFDGGMEAFPRAIARGLADAVKTQWPVVGLERVGDLVVATGPDGARLAARQVVLSTPAPDQARLVAPLSVAAGDILAAVRYVPMVVVALGIPPGDGGAASLPRGFGFLRAAGARGRILGASFPSFLDPACAPAGHALASVFLGGGADPGAADLGDAAILELAIGDLSRALGHAVRPDMTSIHRWARAIPVLSPGHRVRMRDAQALLEPAGITLWGSHVTGVGVNACCAPLLRDA